MLWGKRVVPGIVRMPTALPFMSICLIAISRDFFEMVLPNPVLSVVGPEVLTGLLIANSETLGAFRDSVNSTWLFPCTRPLATGSIGLPLAVDSTTLPLVEMGDDSLLDKSGGTGFSVFPFTMTAAPGRDLPAERGLLGKVVRRFGGVSWGKSERVTGC